MKKNKVVHNHQEGKNKTFSKKAFLKKTFVALTACLIVGSSVFGLIQSGVFSSTPSVVIGNDFPSETMKAEPFLAPIRIEMDDFSDRGGVVVDESETVVISKDVEARTFVLPDEGENEDEGEEYSSVVEKKEQEKNLIPDNPLLELLSVTDFTATDRTMYITADVVNVRAEPSVDADVLASLVAGDVVTQSGYGSKWSRIVMSNGTKGFILSTLITEDFVERAVEEEPATPTPAPTPVPTPAAPPPTEAPSEPTQPVPPSAPTETAMTGTFYATKNTNVRSGPGTDFPITKMLSAGDGVDVVAITDTGWYKSVKGTYVLASLLSDTKPEVPSAPITPPVETSPDAPPAPIPDPPAPVDPANSDLRTYASSFIGIKYVYASSNPDVGFDCSGFVKFIYSTYYGISVPHQSNAVLTTGTEVDASSIQIGDVICYNYGSGGGSDHVGIYVGDGMVIHASSNRSKVVETGFSMDNVVSIRRIVG